MNIGIFCSAYDLDRTYTEPAREFARLLAANGHTLVWGGSDVGLMKIMASGVQDGGGKIIGVSVEFLKDTARKNADEMVIAKNLGERKAALLERSDVIVTMVGGLGTLDEVTEMLELKKHAHHNKQIIFLNTAGFYDGFKQQLERMDQEGFLPTALENLLVFADTPTEAIQIIGSNSQPATPAMVVPEV